MNVTLLCLVLAAGPQANPGDRTASGVIADKASVNLDGNWTVVAIEKNGQPVEDAKNMTVMAKGNTFTCTGKDSKPAMTWKIEFGGQGTVSVQVQEGDGAAMAKKGVYVLTKDMIALCLHAEESAAGAVTTTGPNTKSHCSIILKREGAGTSR
jgi:uncharacterized protein (TIGR03067 family)